MCHRRSRVSSRRRYERNELRRPERIGTAPSVGRRGDSRLAFRAVATAGRQNLTLPARAPGARRGGAGNCCCSPCSSLFCLLSCWTTPQKEAAIRAYMREACCMAWRLTNSFGPWQRGSRPGPKAGIVGIPAFANQTASMEPGSTPSGGTSPSTRFVAACAAPTTACSTGTSLGGRPASYREPRRQDCLWGPAPIPACA